MPAISARLRRAAITFAMLLAAATPRALGAQDSTAIATVVSADSWVRVRVCPERREQPATMGEGRLIPHPAAVILSSPGGGIDSFPRPRVQSLETRVRRERDYRAVGTIIGMIAGPFVARGLVEATSPRPVDLGGGVALVLLGGLVGGGVGGYWLGSRASTDAIWNPVALPASYGSACGETR